MKDFFIKNKMYFIAIITFLALSTAYFYPQTEGKKLKASDLEENKAMRQEMNEHFKKTGKHTLWTNAMFGGMPVYQIASPIKGNFMVKVTPYFQFKIPRPIGRFFVMGMFFFIMLMVLKVDPWLAIIGGLAFAYNANNIVLFKTGHMTKLICMTTFGIIFGGLYLLFQKKNYRIGFVLLVLGLVFNVIANHVQMTYYFGLTILVYFIIHIVYVIRQKRNIMDHLIKPLGVSFFALALAVGANFTNLRTTYTYGQHTMRGKPILEVKADTSSQAEQESSSSTVNGLNWNYAMAWSFGSSDIPSLWVPRFVGGGSQELIKKDQKYYKELQRVYKSRRADRAINMNLYFGGMERNTAGATYFGITIFFLFVLGLFLVKGQLKWWLGISVLLTIMLSMGKNLAWFQHIFFDYFPLYNKFRTPNSIMTVTGFLMPILGMVVATQIFNGKIEKQEIIKRLKHTTYIVGGFVLLFLGLGGTLMNYSWIQDTAYGTGQGADEFRDIVYAARKYFQKVDLGRSLVLLLLTAGVIWAFVNQKLKKYASIAILGVLVMFDIWGISKRYVNDGDFKKFKKKNKTVQMRGVDQQILAVEKERGAYRVLDFSVNTFNTATTSYYHNTIGGYHPAKLQRIQDIIDHYLARPSKNGFDNTLNMFNVKYGINREGQAGPRPTALGNAWFVDSIAFVSTPNEEIETLDEINVANTAVIHKGEFGEYMKGFNPSRNGEIKMLEYAPDRIVYESNSSSEQFAVFSEVWYRPNKAWKVKLNGENVDHIRANYLLRAMKLPAGKNKIEFYFEPDSFYQAEKISMASSSLIILLVLGAIAWSVWKPGDKLEEEETETA